MKVFIYLFIYLLLNSCESKLEKIRENIEGHIINKSTKLSIDSVKIGFLIDYSNPDNQILEEAYYSNVKGYFKIPKFELKTGYQQSNSMRSHSSKYLRIEKEGFIAEILDINDSIYRRNEENYTIYIDTIYLKPIE